MRSLCSLSLLSCVRAPYEKAPFDVEHRKARLLLLTHSDDPVRPFRSPDSASVDMIDFVGPPSQTCDIATSSKPLEALSFRVSSEDTQLL